MLTVRDAHPAWGARKIARCLERDGTTPPAISTIHEFSAATAGLFNHRAGRQLTSGLREGDAEPSLADGLQGLGQACRHGALPPLDGDRRSLALFDLSGGVR